MSSSDQNLKKVPRLKTLYQETIKNKLREQFKYKNIMQVPQIKAIHLNMSDSDAAQDKKVIAFAQQNMDAIAGQKSVVTLVRKSNAAFKIRDGWPIGCKVTLRGNRMYEFLDRLLAIALPRVRDFRGLSAKSFDSRGNYNLGIKEQIIFPEVDYDKVDKIRGFDITIKTSAKTDAEALALLKAFNFPFKDTSSQ